MNGRHYTSKISASHVNAGTSLRELKPRGSKRRGQQLGVPKLHLQCDERVPATCYGGLSLLLGMWRWLKISAAIDDSVRVLQRHKFYHESDHVLAHVANLYAGGTCIEDQSVFQHDPAVLRMLGTDRFPDPTTSGDFLRRFDDASNPGALDDLRAVGDRIQERVWSMLATSKKRRRRRLGKWALIDMDSKVNELSGDQKEGADFSYTGKWSYHPLIVTRANTREVLVVRNRPGNRPSPEGVEDLLETHLPRVGKAFNKVLVRGDSAFDQASIRQACTRHGAHFVLVVENGQRRAEKAAAVADDDWQPWIPPSRRKATEHRNNPKFKPRQCGRNRRAKRALERRYLTKSKEGQSITEVPFRPTLREKSCRLIILRELITQKANPNQSYLLKTYNYRYILSNLPSEFSASDIADHSYDRCDQENIIEQLGSELVMWRTPVREAGGNAAWMELARLAWNLRKALGLLVLPLETIRWEWKRFRRAYVYVAAEVVRKARQTWGRFNPSGRFVTTLLKAHLRLGP